MTEMAFSDAFGAMSSQTAWATRYSAALMNTFGAPQRVLVRGEGCYVWDADGKRYLDLLAGIAVNAVGHAHPLLTSAITAQLATLGHVSNFFATGPQITLAERLLELLDAPEGSRVFFTNSGTEAVEAAVKLSRRTGRTGLVALEGAFHGRSMGALALTHKPAYREPFEPLPGHVVHLPFGDLSALEETLSEGVRTPDGGRQPVAAVFVEPIQGEAGIRPLRTGYLPRARKLTRDAGALLVLDEVQTGIGRTGRWFAHQHPHLGADRDTGEIVSADVVTLAKGLGGGFPIGALVALGEEAATRLGPGQHGTTFGGNPVAASAALATLHIIERDDLLRNATGVGQRLREGISGLGSPLVTGVRGEGLLIAVQLEDAISSALVTSLLDKGFIVNAVAPDALRLAPPLVFTEEQADSFVDALGEALAEQLGAGAGAEQTSPDGAAVVDVEEAAGAQAGVSG